MWKNGTFSPEKTDQRRKAMDTAIKKPDRRVIKTKRAIRNAFVKLLSEKDYNDITIKDIADAADVDRKTVYNYYSGIFEIRDELEDELIRLLDEAIEKLDFRKNIGNPQRFYEILTEVIGENLELYGNLLKIEAKSYVIRKIVGILMDKMLKALKDSPFEMSDIKKLDLIAQFITSGMISAYQQWYNSGMSLPLEEVSKLIGTIILYGITSLDK